MWEFGHGWELLMIRQLKSQRSSSRSARIAAPRCRTCFVAQYVLSAFSVLCFREHVIGAALLMVLQRVAIARSMYEWNHHGDLG